MNDDQLKRIVNEAAHWLSRLHGNDMSDTELRDLEQWKLAHPQHRLAFERMSAQVSSLRVPVLLEQPEHRLIQALNAHSSRRNVLRGGVMGALAVGAWQFIPQEHANTLTTSIAERKVFTLDDGSVLTLNAHSTLEKTLAPDHRRLRLQQGDLFIQCAPDMRNALHVETRFARVFSHDATFSLSLTTQGAQLHVQSSTVVIQSPNQQPQTIKPGYGAHVDSAGDIVLKKNRPHELAWLKGQIELDSEPLSKIADALRPYRSGLLRVSPQAAKLQISGIFSLDDSESTLSLLSLSLPIRITRLGRWLTHIDAA